MIDFLGVILPVLIGAANLFGAARALRAGKADFGVVEFHRAEEPTAFAAAVLLYIAVAGAAFWMAATFEPF